MDKKHREEQILLLLKKHDYLSREQIQKMVSLGGERNAQLVLKNMSHYLSTFTHDRKNIYYLNREGRDMVQSEKVRKKTAKIEHYLMRTDSFLYLGRPHTWKNEMRVKVDNTTFIADSVFVRDKVHHFVEIDNKQSMKQNKNKLNKYRRLAEITTFKLIWCTSSSFRKKRLEELSEGLDMEVLVHDEI